MTYLWLIVELACLVFFGGVIGWCIRDRQKSEGLTGDEPCDCGETTIDDCAQRPTRHCGNFNRTATEAAP